MEGTPGDGASPPCFTGDPCPLPAAAAEAAAAAPATAAHTGLCCTAWLMPHTGPGSEVMRAKVVVVLLLALLAPPMVLLLEVVVAVVAPPGGERGLLPLVVALRLGEGEDCVEVVERIICSRSTRLRAASSSSAGMNRV